MREKPTSLRTFLIIWSGQFVSTLGSEITAFAITLWAWKLTSEATPLALLVFFTRTPRVIAALFAGIIVDRFSRKKLMILGDGVAGVSTLVILGLLLTDNLAIWHIYTTAIFNGLFGYFQGLSFSASMSLIVPEKHYARASAMTFYVSYSGAEIIAPALATVLYYTVGLGWILTLDFMTFLIAISTLAIVTIPQPISSQENSETKETLAQQLTFGFRYLLKRRGLLAILIFLFTVNLISNAGNGIYAPMILARSDNNAAIFASVQSAWGIGGIIGAGVVSIWGGFQRRIHGLLLSTVFIGLAEMLLGLGQGASVWIGAAFLTAFCSPWFGSSNQAIWLAKVEPNVQGRVFATRYFIAQMTTPIGLGISGILADRVFEPVMRSQAGLAVLLGSIFGTGEGSGMALQYTLFGFGSVLIGLSAYGFPILRQVESE
jgi:DHA3 family macrolide efflux protein-like MFS transporter